MAHAYFFKTIADKTGRNRLRPLSGQSLPDGTAIRTDWNVQSDKRIRSEYPLNTVFGCDTLEAREGFYTASQIYPMGLPISEYKSASHRPPRELEVAYSKLIGVGTDEEPVAAPKEEEPEKEVSTTLSRMMSNDKFTPPTVKKDGFYVSNKDWYLLLRNIQNQVNTMMIGPTGTGKTELVMLACEKLGIPCHVYDMSSMYDPVAGLLGVHRLIKGGSVFDYAQFTKDVQEPCVILLDELSRAPVTSLNILFPCLDSRRTLPVEIAGGEDVRSIKIHEECCFIATANVGAEYTGTMSMDRALVGRFFPVELDYLPMDVERDVLVKRCRVRSVEAEQVVRVAEQVRALYRKQEISCSLSTRETLMVAELIADGWKLLDAMELVFLPLFEGTRAEGERGIIAKILMSH